MMKGVIDKRISYMTLIGVHCVCACMCMHVHACMHGMVWTVHDIIIFCMFIIMTFMMLLYYTR